MKSPLTIGQEVLRRKLGECGVEVTPYELLRLLKAVERFKSDSPLDVRKGECACCHRFSGLVRDWCVDCLITRKGVEVEP